MIVGNGESQARRTTVDKVVGGEPGRGAPGSQAGDRIVAINGTPIRNWDDLGANVRPNAGRQITVTVMRDGQTVDGQGHARERSPARASSASTRRASRQTYSVVRGGRRSRSRGWAAPRRRRSAAWRRSSRRRASSSTARRCTNPNGKGSFTNEERPRSIVGIVADGSDIVGGNFWVLLVLLATINLFLALFNLIPLLPFDGGHAAVAIYEAIASRIKGPHGAGRLPQAHADHRRGARGACSLLGLSTMFLDIRSIVTGT